MTDFYGRPLRSNGGPASEGYFDDSTSYYAAEPRDNPSLRRADSSSTPRRSPPINNNRMASAPNPAAPDGVSPDLIAAITEKVKKELLEHLKQTGSIDDQTRAPPMQRDPSNKSSSTSSPPPTARRVYTPPSPTIPVKTNAAPYAAEPIRSPPRSPQEKASGVRFSDREFSSRPTAGRTYSTTELSTIDQKWGRLFDRDGNATTRLGQFLRGLANHIIDDFEPKKSIVVTPAKMATYYENHALDKEPHPLATIFKAQQHEHISRLYQDIGCEHHLVQDDPRSAPIVPSLTPVGFAQWMTIHILAYPEEESKRLNNVVLAMPIDADGDLVDGKPERLPKQISRYLLPERPDSKSRELLDEAITNFMNDLGSTSRRKPSITSPPPLNRHSSTSQTRKRPVEIHQTKTSPTSAIPNPLERERKPYSGTPAASESSNNEEPVQIERERAPYTAKEGAGKVYGESISNRGPSERNPSQRDPSIQLGRANSTTTRNTTRTQADMPEPRHNRAPSISNQYMPPPRSGPRRTSSPPIKSFSNSTPLDIHNTSKYGPDPASSSSSGFTNQSQSFNPGSYGSTGSFPPPPPPVDIHRRSRDERGYRRDTDDDLRFPGEFNSPRDAEKWDRYQDIRGGEPDRYDGPYERPPRPSIPIDPRETRGAPPDDWYREKGRAAEYEPFGNRRY
ncbi:uncharacterized protein LY89DRAFT_45107 [Mollisia scopiformis]|uniref:DUF7514 domain-containing protein n=1 Tax=Mollisia scopiformis TaxID=149040 RepID=A0A194XDP2_MOLSC|nr:uncharacterized protein LY89DRAFT_45107 [Mollisia scopiformis]KUJ18293.1 hypothetical protein LY89DRAFT_45107 [Mollisia scopiformis]